MDFACRWGSWGILGDEKFKAWICGGSCQCRVAVVCAAWEATCPGLGTGDMAGRCGDSTWMGAHGDCAACDAPGSCTLGDCNWICSSCKCLETLLPLPCCASFSNLCNTSADRSSSHLGKGGEQAPDPPVRPNLTSLLYSGTATLEPFSSKWLDSCDRLRSVSDAGSYNFGNSRLLQFNRLWYSLYNLYWL